MAHWVLVKQKKGGIEFFDLDLLFGPYFGSFLIVFNDPFRSFSKSVQNHSKSCINDSKSIEIYHFR